MGSKRTNGAARTFVFRGGTRIADTVTAKARDLIRGAYKLDGTLLLALDVPRTVEL